MAELSELDFEGKYNNSSTGLFKNNTTRDITPERVRTLVTDTKDSFMNVVDDAYTGFAPQVSTSGTNTYTATLDPAITAYANSQAFKIKFTNASSGASTLNLNGLGAKKLYVNPTTQADSGDVVDEQVYLLIYDAALDSASGGFLMIGGSGGGGSGIVETIVAGTNITVDDTDPANPIISASGGGVSDGDKGDVVVSSSGAVWTVESASDTAAGKVELATSAETITGSDTARATTPAGVHAKVVGVQDLFVRAAAMSPRTTGGCGVHVPIEFATSLVNIPVLPFDQTTQEYAQFEITPPRKWNNGTITVVPYWTATSGSGTVRWAINGGMFRNDDALTVALGTAQNSDDTLIAANDLHIGPATSAITLAGTGQDANLIVIQVSRDPSNDTLTADALLIGISIRFTTDAAIDA